ncbi:chemotaxis protein CheD [Geothermobacter hydrogeniphilus]|uniref:Probable chemoreceptor glutamine deamidase CheD n=1 Tax=Geothermobacter hydrogeniphilus TaxID=1969733 RepID=A0A2K2HET7_9BACT|nr:chemotaxis protein CheD [Geothermobacter hydrogeniphilus]PNU21806.1 chemotaxis protein CheD [Geothermobacter hydrogeniphilus]
MNPKLRVGIAEIRIAGAPERLVSYGLGSCLGVMLYAPELCCGGLAHTLLPEPGQKGAGNRPGKFVRTAIPALIAGLEQFGAERRQLVAKLCGGAHMFQNLNGRMTIGERNIRVARMLLEELRIPLLAEDVGGCQGRTCEFRLEDGKVLVRLARGRDKLREL